MRRRRLLKALDDCLSALERGESLQSCLARYPDLADELRPLLQAAQAVRAMGEPRPRPVAQASGWLRFSRRAAQLRAAQVRRPWRWLAPAAIVACVVAVMAASLTATVMAASRSLPGDPLYRVKLLAEEAHVLATWDREARARLLLDQADRRIAEIEKVSARKGQVPGEALAALRSRVARASRLLEGYDTVLAQQAQARLEQQQAYLIRLAGQAGIGARDDLVATIAGLHNARLRLAGRGVVLPAESLAGGLLQVEGVARPTSEPGVWLIGPYQVRVGDVTLGDVPIEEGKLVRVLVGRDPDRVLRALTVAVVGSPGQELIIRGVVRRVEGQELDVDGRLVRLASGAALDTFNVGDTVQVRAYVSSDALVATEVRLLSGPALVSTFSLDGTAEEDLSLGQGQSTVWRVAGQRFRIIPSTVIEAQAGEPRQGAFVRVQAQRRGDELVALKVTVLSAAAPTTGSLWVQGVYQGSSGGKWLVGGTAVDPPPGASPPPPGSLVRVEAVRDGDRVEARGAVVVLGQESGVLVQLRGTLREIRPDGTWQVGDATVRVGAEAHIVGRPEVGNEVEVQARSTVSGLEAVYVQVLTPSGGGPSTPATPTPAPTPTPTPSPTPTVGSAPPTATPTVERSLPARPSAAR
ncbi:MAG: DUF5666 domain-containing protein [Dehalococcoidia bacterium]|jgi:hypothetical protein|nr:DUF5666 domain-containing protein [Dehalococcoidia bacterium]MDW8009030.1 DUF5666 domain-containing protein [Chloroflexota bacterium]